MQFESDRIVRIALPVWRAQRFIPGLFLIAFQTISQPAGSCTTNYELSPLRTGWQPGSGANTVQRKWVAPLFAAEVAGLPIRLALSRFSLTLGPICSILETLRGVAPGVCVYTPGLGWSVPWRDWLEQATGCWTFYVSSQAKALRGPTPAVLTRTDLFGSG